MCTTMLFTPGAMIDGSMVVTHSDDDELSDQRVIAVPAGDHPADSQRPVMPEQYAYPRMVTDDRGPGYESADWPATVPLGSIPQVEHTYAYYDGNYGIINEHALMIGECTDAAHYQPAAVTAEEAKRSGRHIRLFYSSELSRVALERCRTAREAVTLMGELIDTYGYYSTGETLLVADDDEAWVFEMCALPDEKHHSAWVAQRVPDGEVFVAANEFRIRTVSTDDPDQLCSRHLFPGCKKVGWWRPQDGPLDWLRTVSPGEYNHPYYSLRRVWRLFDRINPDLGLSPWVEDGYTTAYPFSIAPAEPLSVAEVQDLYRDHYEGTEFDLTRGVAAGPYGDPHRFTGPYDGNQNNVSDGTPGVGAWERSISVFYQGYTYVLHRRPGRPVGTAGVMWFAPDVSYTSVFAPFYAGARSLPAAYQGGNPRRFDRAFAWWAFDFVANWTRLNFQRMTCVDVIPLQRRLEAMARDRIAECDDLLATNDDPAGRAEAMQACGAETAEHILQRWWELADRLIAKYSDGYVNPAADDRTAARPIGYPAAWLGRTDYADGPLAYRMPLTARA